MTTGGVRLAAALGLIAALGCGEQQPAARAAVLEVEGFGEIRLEFLPDKAPKSVANFLKLASEGYYDGTTFHRVVPDFVIQGGDPLTKNDNPRDDGSGGPGYAVDDEFSDTPQLRGTVSMANKGFPRSGGSQFFILVKDARWLDGKYSVFARVTSGMEVADKIATVARDGERPRKNVVVRRVRIE